MKFNANTSSKMLTILEIACVLLSVKVLSCEATVNTVDGNDTLGLTYDKGFDAAEQNGCEWRNSTYFICCVNYKALICFEGQYLPKEVGIEVALLVNNVVYWQEIISGRSPPEICPVDIPKIGEICFKFYEVQLIQYHFCLNVSIKLDIIHKFPLKKIHVGCFGQMRVLPNQLNCTITNTTETSFSLLCQEDEGSANKLWLEVTDSDGQLIDNKTGLAPKFDVSNLHPSSVYYAQVFVANKYGHSIPTLFNITTHEEPVVERIMANAVVNIYLMCAMLSMLVFFFIGLAVGIVLWKINLTRKSKTFAQIKDELAYRLLPEQNEKVCSTVTYE